VYYIEVAPNKTGLLEGKTIKVNKFPKDKKVKLFCVTVSANRTEYVVTNDLTQDYTLEVREVSVGKLRNFIVKSNS